MVELYEYQKKYLATLPPRAIMAADTGVGKTYMSLAHYAAHGEGRPLLILAPASKVRTRDWERDVDGYFGKGMIHYEVYSYEKFSRNPTLLQFSKGKRAIWHRAAPAFGGVEYAVIADEVHKAKNPQSGVGKALYNVAKDAHFFIGLSATPLPNGWIDFANYSKIWRYTPNITAFKNKYCNYETFKGFPELKSYNREPELGEQWRSISRRLTKAEAHELPPRTFIPVDFKRPTEYARTIITRKNAAGEVLDNPSSLAHALRQTLTPVKLDYLSDLIEGTNENVVIFYNYVSEREQILAMLAKRHKDRPVRRQDGERHELPAKEDWGKEHRSITLSHYKSGATGVEMTYATVVIYFSPTYSYAEYMQSIGRVYRNGQTGHTTFYLFRTTPTIEQAVYKALENKGDFQAAQWEIK